MGRASQQGRPCGSSVGRTQPHWCRNTHSRFHDCSHMCLPGSSCRTRWRPPEKQTLFSHLSRTWAHHSDKSLQDRCILKLHANLWFSHLFIRIKITLLLMSLYWLGVNKCMLYCHSPLGGRPGRPHWAGHHTDALQKALWVDWGCRGVWYLDC